MATGITAAGPTFIIKGTDSGSTSVPTFKSYWHSPAWWGGHLVSVRNEPGQPPCETHNLHQIDNYGHPVNELWCYDCFGVALDPEPRRCTNADCWHHKEPGWCNGTDGCKEQ